MDYVKILYMKHPRWCSNHQIYHIFDQIQQVLYEEFYYVATSFDPEFGSSSGHDTGT